MFATVGSNAQQIRKSFSILLPIGNIRLDSLSKRLRLQSGYILSFNASSIQPTTTIELLKSPVHLGSLLDYLKSRYQFSVTVVGDHIILNRLPKRKPGPEKEQTTLHAAKILYRKITPRPEKHQIIKDRTVLKQGKRRPKPSEVSLPPIDLLTVKRQLSVTDLPSVSPSIPFAPSLMGKEKSELGSQPLIQAADTLTRHKMKMNLMDKLSFSGGSMVDECFYLSPTIKLGFPFLYLIGVWRTNFTISGFGYGIGSTHKLSKNWRVQININKGTLKNTSVLYYGLAPGSSPSANDSTFIIKTKGSLLRGELFIETRIGNKLNLQFGPVINLLNYKNYANGKPVSEVPSFPSNIDVTKKYHLLKPPYFITESYNREKSSGRKLWVGLQVGLFYRF